METYPLQSEMSQNHRVLHTHIFKEVIPPPQSGQASRLMVTEVDQHGVERNRQADFFFNGFRSHNGWIDSWSEATRLAIYWRRHYNIPDAHDDNTSWASSWQDRHQLPGHADNTTGTYGEDAESEMEDQTSVLGTPLVKENAGGVHFLENLFFQGFPIRRCYPLQF